MAWTSRKAGWLPLPADRVPPHGVVEAFERGGAAVAELEPLARGELSHHVRDEDIAGIGLGADAGGELDGGPEQVVILRHRLAGVEADPLANRRVRVRLAVPGAGLLDRDRALDRARR